MFFLYIPMSIAGADDSTYLPTENCETGLNEVQKDSILDVSVGIRWKGQDCLFSDWIYIDNLNLWHENLPPEIASLLPGSHPGEIIEHRFTAGELVAAYQSNNVKILDRNQFQPSSNSLFPIHPRLGRFYPQEYFRDVPGIYRDHKFPSRIVSIEDGRLTVDFNHPLAAKPIDMLVRIEAIHPPHGERGGRSKDIPVQLCDHGPGMQDTLPDADIDFWTDSPFERLDEGEDSDFFSSPSLTPFWDNTALGEVSKLYDELVPDGAHVLDLMAGVHSPLQESNVSPVHITCAGLNPVELNHNPICDDRLELNVNTLESLPFDDESFNVVLIHAAIEYVTQPELLFSQISRVLKPGGRIIVSFSNRSVNEKAIRLWNDVHEFERPGIVLSYLRKSGAFRNLQEFSKRGLLRPEDDRLADRLLLSDPVYAVWGEKIR
jgi:hypothetical protein